MTKKKIRYSELAPEAEPTAGPSPVARDDSQTVVPSDARDLRVPPSQPTPRARRNSSPVELAHALAAARAAEAAAEVLAERALLPAETPVRRYVAPLPPPTVEMLMFRVGDERFAVDLLSVEEVIDLPVIHHVPEMPPAMLGVVAVRGMLTPVYSPQFALGLALAQRAAVLIFLRGAARVGVLIDDVDDAIPMDLREMRTSHASPEGDNVVLGVVRHEEMLVAVVDVDALIAACQQAALLEIA